MTAVLQPMVQQKQSITGWGYDAYGVDQLGEKLEQPAKATVSEGGQLDEGELLTEEQVRSAL